MTWDLSCGKAFQDPSCLMWSRLKWWTFNELRWNNMPWRCGQTSSQDRLFSTYLLLSWQVKITGPRRSRLFLQNFIFSLPYVFDNGALTHHEYVQRVLHYSVWTKPECVLNDVLGCLTETSMTLAFWAYIFSSKLTFDFLTGPLTNRWQKMSAWW